MTNIERHPAPEKLLRQITAETVYALTSCRETDNPTVSMMEGTVGLIAKAWGLPQEPLQNSLDLIQRQKQAALSGSTEAVLPHGEDQEPYNGPMIAELLWGLFETAVKLESAQDRAAIHKLALMMADCLGFDDWIMKHEPAVANK